MTAIDQLRRLLDERGVVHSDHYLSTTWRGRNGMKHLADEPMADGMLVVDMLTPEQAIAATLESSTLTADQVREAIFNGSSYASYDGVKYYADGINMQAIADELNAQTEQTCNLIEDGNLLHCSNCGGAAEKQLWAYWSYCPNCRAKVIK